MECHAPWRPPPPSPPPRPPRRPPLPPASSPSPPLAPPPVLEVSADKSCHFGGTMKIAMSRHSADEEVARIVVRMQRWESTVEVVVLLAHEWNFDFTTNDLVGGVPCPTSNKADAPCLSCPISRPPDAQLMPLCCPSQATLCPCLMPQLMPIFCPPHVHLMLHVKSSAALLLSISTPCLLTPCPAPGQSSLHPLPTFPYSAYQMSISCQHFPTFCLLVPQARTALISQSLEPAADATRLVFKPFPPQEGSPPFFGFNVHGRGIGLLRLSCR